MTNMESIDLPAQIFRTRRFTLGVPQQLTITPDESAVLFLRSRAGDDPVTCLWAVDLDSGVERTLADPAELPARPAADQDGGIARYAPSTRAGLVAFTLDGGLWVVDLAGGPARRLPAADSVADPRPDPAGERIAYVSGGALRVIDTAGTDDRVVMAPDGPEVTFGVCESTSATSRDGGRGYWWAPDGTALLVARTDSARVGQWFIADPSKPAAAPRAISYAAAGEDNAEVTLWIAGLDGTRTLALWDAADIEYVVGAGWDEAGPYTLVQSRDQQAVRFLGIDPATGQTTVLAEQHDPCWVQLVPGLPARSGGGALIAHADQGGTRHLTVGGTPVTPSGLQLREVLGVEGDRVLFTASREPTQCQLWSYQPDEGARRLSAETGWHDGVRRGRTLVNHDWAADKPGGRVEVLRAGKPVVSIQSLTERPALEANVTSLVLGPRQLRANLFLPSWYQPGSGQLPVLADPYGGASTQRATAERSSHSLVSQWFADQGFAVLVADGAGTPGRGPSWEREVYGDLFGPVLDDQVIALHEAARRYPCLDLTRVGIRGWSFGGSLAAVAVLRRPDVFHAAVAGAGATDQRLYNAHWRERFLGHPDKFPDRYESNSLVLDAPKLTRPLLLIHGLADHNVHVAHTLRLSSALLAAGRPHEVLLLPGIGHQALASPVTENLLWHQVRFLQRHLDAIPPEGR